MTMNTTPSLNTPPPPRNMSHTSYPPPLVIHAHICRIFMPVFNYQLLPPTIYRIPRARAVRKLAHISFGWSKPLPLVTSCYAPKCVYVYVYTYVYAFYMYMYVYMLNEIRVFVSNYVGYVRRFCAWYTCQYCWPQKINFGSNESRKKKREKKMLEHFLERKQL